MAGAGTSASMLTLANITDVSALGVVFGIFGGISAGTAPDKLEYLALGIRWVKHRTLTHWPFLWLALIGVGIWVSSYVGDFAYAFSGYAMGALFHLLGDWMTPKGIPILLPRTKSMHSCRLVKSTRQEFFVVLIFCLLAGLICKLQLESFSGSLQGVFSSDFKAFQY